MLRKCFFLVVVAGALGFFLGIWGTAGDFSFARRAKATTTLVGYICEQANDPCPVCPQGTPRQGNSMCDTNIYPYHWGGCVQSPTTCTYDSGTCGPDLDCINFPQMPTGGTLCDVGVYDYCS
jgi:hypothetical protein